MFDDVLPAAVPEGRALAGEVRVEDAVEEVSVAVPFKRIALRCECSDQYRPIGGYTRRLHKEG